MSLTSYRAAPPRATRNILKEHLKFVLTKSGSDLLSHVLRRSTIGAAVLNGRVRDGIECFTRAMTTKLKKSKNTSPQNVEPNANSR